ncbi:MAG: hypothetical protein GXO48_04475 [Chlorobi bacterium]|nr:hypothetical protein [Chlorobiota bacterium]
MRRFVLLLMVVGTVLTTTVLVATSSSPKGECSATTTLNVSCSVSCEDKNFSCDASVFYLKCRCGEEYGKIEIPEQTIKSLKEFTYMCHTELQSKEAKKIAELTAKYLHHAIKNNPKEVERIGKQIELLLLALPSNEKKKVLEFFRAHGFEKAEF